MITKPPGKEMTYKIQIKEKLNPSLLEWFGISANQDQEGKGTLLVGQFPDQSALRGFLDELWNLNLTILSVEKIDD
ncbi:MAG: hypothetical protein MUC85_13160 [Anaerolineales bacterium]|jgi:hypothetical protein|nr:hypothetical protein [Anaerolineales bacterium]